MGDWLERGSNRWNQGRDLSPLVLRAAADFILERRSPLGRQAASWGTKAPTACWTARQWSLMHQVYPDARLIYIVRDGRDTAISHRFQAFIDFPEQLSQEDLHIRDDFARDPEPFLRGERSIFTEKAIRRAAEGWVRNVEETDRLGKERYGERYFSLRYEDLLARPWAEMQRIWAFPGRGPGCAGVGKRAGQPNSIRTQTPTGNSKRRKRSPSHCRKGKQGAWRELFTSHDRQVFHQAAGKTLAAWGYE